VSGCSGMVESRESSDGHRVRDWHQISHHRQSRWYQGGPLKGPWGYSGFNSLRADSSSWSQDVTATDIAS